jgi:hypothetical protein
MGRGHLKRNALKAHPDTLYQPTKGVNTHPGFHTGYDPIVVRLPGNTDTWTM